MDEAQKYELEETIKELEGYRGRHTEFITVLIPAGFNIFNVVKQIEDEKGTATNIKSNSTRKNVIDALEKVARQLKTIGETPPNGIAVYAGNVSEVEGKDDLRIWTIEPPKPLKIRMYRCDQTFVLDPLKEMCVTDDVYGLIIIERKEASIGILEGKSVRMIEHLTSGVPSKVRAGGQCLSPDTLIMKSDGEIIEIKDSHNPLIITSENFNSEKTEETPIIAKWENEKQLFKVTTCYPKIEIKSSGEHTFFVRTENGIEEKMLSDISEGDYLVMPEKINLNLEDQKIDFVPTIKQNFNMKKIEFPPSFDVPLSRLLGYYLGDGSYELDRLNFFDQRKEIVKHYQNLIEKIFGIKSDLRIRNGKNYWQLRVYSRIISQFFKSVFTEREKTLKQRIPMQILKSSDISLASFIAGFFDAEGYIGDGRVAAGFHNEFLAKQLQFALIRIGIISSLDTYDNNKNPYSDNTRYIISIDDLESLKRFQTICNFCCKEKRDKLNKILNSRSTRNKVRQLIVNGKDVARIIRNSGLNTRDFKCPSFFCNKRQMSKEIFKSKILNKIQDPDLKNRLNLFYNSNLIAVKISKIEKLGFETTIDIETKSHNFLANGLVVHNSAQRYHRITEGLAKEFFRRVAEVVKDSFFEMKNLKGILVGGPIPTKEEFLETGQLVTQLKDKVIAVKDIGDTGIAGLRALVQACEETLEEQEITKQRKILDEFFSAIGKTPEKVAYGEVEVEQRLNEGVVGKLILSKSLPREKIHKFEALARQTSVEVHLVSNETAEGVQFDNLGSVGGLLRYAVHN
jgi:peptide subunit release factor 1 (eRF1)/intein/homing endonuclease